MLPKTFDVQHDGKTWERVWRKLRARQMPPADADRPADAEYEPIERRIAEELDRAAAAAPRPGRTATLRRLNRAEYQNAIRDLLDLNVDATTWLPRDEATHGFDNITVGDLSPTRLNRYVSAAQAISRLALGHSTRGPDGDTFRLPADLTQEDHVEGLPLGTRGGATFPHTFSQAGTYEVRIRLARDRNEHVEGVSRPHELITLVDRQEVGRFTIEQPQTETDHTHLDDHLVTRFFIETPGLHQLTVTFLQDSASLMEIRRQPYLAHFNMHRHPRQTPAVYQVSLTGPWGDGHAGDSPSRRRLGLPTADTPCDADTARHVLRTTLRRAYRRKITADDEQSVWSLYSAAQQESGTEAGLEAALAGILVSPNFLLRIEHEPAGLPAGTPYRVDDFDLATRLSFFLWSSLPDDTLLDLAAANRLHEPDQLRAQVERLLADPRSESLVNNFADQWLHLRNLASTTPDLRLFPDFDDNLRQSLHRETELLVADVFRNNLPVTQLLSADYTFLNERLARHYGVAGVYGSHFRQTPSRSFSRGGILRQGSVLTVTSYATRTSPVIRGKWILENLLGTPPPPPPANVPALKDNTVAANLSVRDRLAAHRQHSACANCHAMIDPLGFALEGFDAVGRQRTLEDGQPVDSTAQLATGLQVTGVDDLEQELLRRPEVFVSTLTEKLLTFALGRELDEDDGPAVRHIVSQSATDQYRFATLVMNIVQSVPFQMRTTE